MQWHSTIAALAVVGIISSSAFAEPQSYPLLCRGGPSMRIATGHDADEAGVPGALEMAIFFRPGSQAGSVQEPGSGECTWLDRTLGHNEPMVMSIRSPRVEFAFQVTGDGRVFADGRGLRLSVEGVRQSSEAADWQYLIDGVMQGQLFTAHVYNESGRAMVITRVRP